MGKFSLANRILRPPFVYHVTDTRRHNQENSLVHIGIECHRRGRSNHIVNDGIYDGIIFRHGRIMAAKLKPTDAELSA